jgi:Demerecviridae HNH endonuclease
MVDISLTKEKELPFAKAVALFRYDDRTGKIFWRTNHRRIKAGDEAGSIASSHGYRIVSLKQRTYLQHRVVWLLYYGEWPKGLVDHINLDKLDNRIENLRAANYSQSNANRRGKRKRVGSLKGASFLRGRRVWRSSIKMDGKTKNLGDYRTELEAHLVFCAAAKLCHGSFARTGP